MIREWKKNQIDTFIQDLSAYYKDCSAVYFNSSCIEDINDDEKEYLNSNINLNNVVNSKNDFILHETLKYPAKNNFSFFLIRSRNINIRIRGADEDGYSVFMRIAENYIKNRSIWLPRLFCTLFERGYRITETDLKFTREIYKGEDFESEGELERWAWIRFAAKLNDSKKFEKALEKDRELFTIFSYLRGRPVKFKFKNLKEVAHNAIQYYRESGDIILKAMKVYNVFNKVVNLDNNGKFQRKHKEYIENKPYQDKEFEQIARELFPNL